MRLGPWVQSEAPRLSLGRGGEPRAHSVPRSRISTPSFERHRGHNTASRPYSIAARLLKRDLVAIPSGQLNTPLRAGIAPGPATARRLAGTLALSTDPMRANTPTGAHTHSAAAAHATATPRRDVRTARNRTQRRLPVGRGTPAHAYHIGHIVPQAFGLWLSHAPWRSATGTCSAASRRRAAWNTAWCRRRPWRATPQDTRCASPQNLAGCLTASPARITQNIFTNTRRVKHARRHAEARRAESSLGSLSVRT